MPPAGQRTQRDARWRCNMEITQSVTSDNDAASTSTAELPPAACRRRSNRIRASNSAIRSYRLIISPGGWQGEVRHRVAMYPAEIYRDGNRPLAVDRCPSVRLSVTFVYCIQTAKDIVKLCVRPRSPHHSSFLSPFGVTQFQGNPSAGGGRQGAV